MSRWRLRALRQGSVVLAIALAAGCEETKTPTEPSPEAVLQVIDEWPTWSRDMQWIAYHRRVPSHDGPPGVYIIPASGGTPRLVAAGNYDEPDNLRFSPDGSSLVAGLGGEIGLIEVATGAVTQLTFTDNLATSPDWSRDGKQVIYARPFRDRSEPADSAGLFVYDIGSHTERPFSESGITTVGLAPRYSPDGARIAFTVGGSIYSIRTDGSQVLRVTDPPPKRLCFFPRWVQGGAAIVYLVYGGGIENWIVRADGTAPEPWPVFLGLTGDVSPDQRWVVVNGADPTDSTQQRGVLFVRRFDNVNGAAMRQLTHYQPPDSIIVDGIEERGKIEEDGRLTLSRN